MLSADGWVVTFMNYIERVTGVEFSAMVEKKDISVLPRLYRSEGFAHFVWFGECVSWPRNMFSHRGSL